MLTIEKQVKVLFCGFVLFLAIGGIIGGVYCVILVTAFA